MRLPYEWGTGRFLWSLISLLYNFKVIGMNSTAPAVISREMEMIGPKGNHIMGPMEKSLEFDTSLISMESFES